MSSNPRQLNTDTTDQTQVASIQQPQADSFLAISATFTAESLQQTLEFWSRELNLNHNVKFAPYDQVFQQLLDPASLLMRNRNGVNIILIRFEDWTRFGTGSQSSLTNLEENVRHLISCLRTAAANSTSPLLVCVCPASPVFLADPERQAFSCRMEAFIQSCLQELSTVHLVTSAELDELYPVAECHDPHGDELGHIPYTPSFFAALGTMLARKVFSMRTTPYKVIVLDCDETLWRGICGEDGPQGAAIDPPRRALQEFMRAQYDAGMLLALCSKNNEEDVLETFRCHPEMPLRLEHFVSWRINWEPKSNNLVSLAEDLNLGLDSFIFVDDNPKECAEVQANCPEVLALPLPPSQKEIPHFLKHVWAFNRSKATEEDKRRTELYSQRMERSRLERQASSLEDFLQSLNLEIHIAPMAPQQLPRVSQLTQRTNQLNITTIRRSENEIQSMLSSGEAECLTVDVTDRFGSYGLTGVVIFREEPEVIAVDTLLLSCRALGRGVEHRMLGRLGEIALERNRAFVEVPFVPSQRNRIALKFLESVSSQDSSEVKGERHFRFRAEEAAAVVYRPSTAPQKTSLPDRSEARQLHNRPSVDLLRIAKEFSDPQKVLEAIRIRSVNSAAPTAKFTAPRTELEGELSRIWAELLNLPSVGIHDNFFDLGGHSLLAVQLLSRVRRAFDVELSLEVVYSGAFTVEELAKAIEINQIELAGADQYSSILQELEGLSAEEVAALLAEEEDSPQGGA